MSLHIYDGNVGTVTPMIINPMTRVRLRTQHIVAVQQLWSKNLMETQLVRLASTRAPEVHRGCPTIVLNGSQRQ